MAGELLGVTATDALELGIDIGSLDCAISVGFPGTVSSLRQQWGRAGRRSPGLAVLVASEDALDQYFMREPETLLGRTRRGGDPRPREPTRAGRPCALGGLRGADRRRATRRRSARRRSSGPRAARAEANRRGLRLGAARTTRPHASRSAPASSTRSPSSTRRRARCSAPSSARAPTRRSTTAPSTSTSASSTSCSGSTSTPAPRSSPAPMSTGTRRRRRRRTTRSSSRAVERRLGLELFFGRVSVTERVIAYQRKSISGGDTLETVAARPAGDELRDGGDLVLPDAAQLDGLEEMPKLLSSLHAAEHSLIALLPLWAMCDRWDIGGLSTNIHPQTGCRRSSSTTGTPAASGSPSAASSASRAGSTTRRGCSRAARAPPAAPPASRARSAAT